MPRKKKAPLPAAGDVFAVPLEDGRYSVCRVISDRTTNPELSIRAVLVASSQWIGSAVPKLDEEQHRPILILTHHSFEDAPNIRWIDTPVPDSFVWIGTIKPTKEEGTLNWPSHSDWFNIVQQPLRQWRWDHEREAVLAEDDARRQATAQQEEADMAGQRARLNSITLEQLESHAFFPDWQFPPKEAIEASRKIMAKTVRALRTLGRSASEQNRMQELQRCIESFNELDRQLEFIETVERDDICREFEAIVHACGLGSHEFLADEWRDW